MTAWLWVCTCGHRLNAGEEGQALDRVSDHLASPGTHGVDSIERGNGFVLRWGDPTNTPTTKRQVEA